MHSIIIRYRNSSSERERNLKIVLKHFLNASNVEIIVSVMECDIDLSSYHVKKIFTPDPFESSKANNIGAAASSKPYLCFLDADILFPLRAFKQAADFFAQGVEAIRVTETCVNLGNTARVEIEKGHIQKVFQRINAQTPGRDAPGGSLMITRPAFVKVGGYCELFQKYGWEDCYMRVKVNKVCKKKALGLFSIHLPHETNYQSGYQAVNAPLYQELLNGNIETIIKRDRDALLQRYPKLAG